jgi:hypothetical protein
MRTTVKVLLIVGLAMLAVVSFNSQSFIRKAFAQPAGEQQIINQEQQQERQILHHELDAARYVIRHP